MVQSANMWPHDSVILGYDQIKYESSLTAMNRKHSESALSVNRSRFTRVKDSVHFGDGKARDFNTSNQQIGVHGTGPRTVLVPGRKPNEGNGAVVMGYDTVKPSSESQAVYQYDPIAAKEAIAFRDQVRQRSCGHPSHSVSWNDTIGYISESKSSFSDKSKLSMAVTSTCDRKKGMNCVLLNFQTLNTTSEQI